MASRAAQVAAGEIPAGPVRAGNACVLQVVANLDVGGAQAVVRTLARYLPEHGWTPVVVALRDGPLRADLEAIGTTVEIVEGRDHPLTSPLPALAELIRIRRGLADVAARHRAEVVQTHLLRSLDFLALTLRGQGSVRAVFWTLHNARLELREDQLPDQRLLGPKRLAYRLLYFGGARMADGFVAVARDVALEARRMYRPPRDKLHLIPNGVDLDATAGQDRATIRHELGLPPDSHVVAVVAKLTEQKGHAILLRAMGSLLGQDSNLHVLIAGDGPLADALHAQAAGMPGGDRVRFLGVRSDVRAMLAAADLFVLPSLWEGLPMALLEAMAAGLPVVATAVSGTRDVVVDGVTGILVPPGEELALADAIEQLITDRQTAEAMGSAGRQRVAEEFSGSRLAERHAAMYAAAVTAERA